jgi:hypothetical protein
MAVSDDIPTKPCTALGCCGTMYFHGPMAVPPLPTHLEFPVYASWVCAVDPAHVELVSPDRLRKEDPPNPRSSNRILD